MVPLWIAVLVLTCYASAAATPRLYSNPAERVAAAKAINASPAIVALYGPITDVNSEGELAMTKMTVLYAGLVLVMMLFVLRRHTRVEEESGRAELIGAGAFRSETPLGNAVLYCSLLAMLLGAMVCGANIAGGLPFAGSVAFGALWAGTALVGLGVSAVAIQMSASSRTCAGLASFVFGVLFGLRALADTTRLAWLGWTSPLGWNTRVQAYGSTRWAVLLLYPVAGAGLVLIARRLHRSRDLGSGVFQARPGPDAASQYLRGAPTLTLRLHRGAITGWALTLGVLGAVFGAMAPSFNGFASSGVQAMLSRLGGTGELQDSLLASILSVLALVITCFGIAVVVHQSADEHDGRTEAVLATGTSRSNLFASMAGVSIGGSTLLLAITGIATGLATLGQGRHPFTVFVVSALVQAPAIWVVIALASMAFSLRGSWAVAGWGVLVVFVSLGQVGELLGLPRPLLDLSPYSHVPAMPQEPFRVVPSLIMTALATLILVVSWFAYTRRDIG